MFKNQVVDTHERGKAEYQWENLRYKFIKSRHHLMVCTSCQGWHAYKSRCFVCNGLGFLALDFKTWVTEVLPSHFRLWM